MTGNKTKGPFFRHIVKSSFQYIVPLIIIAVTLNVFSLYIIYRRELDRMQYELDASANNLTNYFEQVERFAFDISINDTIQDLLLTGSNPYISAYAQASAFDSFLGLNRYYDLNLIHIGIMTLDQKSVLAVGYIPIKDEGKVPTYEGISTGEWVLSGSTSYYDRTSKLYDIVSYYQNIYHLPSNKSIGIVRVDVNVQYLQSLFAQTGTDNLRNLYIRQNDMLLSLSGERPVSIPVSEINKLSTISSQAGTAFVLLEKFNTKTLIYENSFILPLSISTLIFVIIFALFSHQLLGQIITPIYTLNKTISTMSTSEPISKLEFKKGTPEIKAIFDGFNQLIDSLNGYIDKNREILHQEQLAETLFLQSQINPHFLYNTLDSLRWIALKNQDVEVAEEVYNLSKIYRYYLNHGDSFVPLDEELQLIDTYMAIQAIRFGEKFEFRVDIDEADRTFLIPKLLLQPLVENSVQHGLSDRESDCRIILSVKRRREKVSIRIVDNGCGMEKDVLEKIKNNSLPEENSYAIANVKKRLALYYGDAASVLFYSRVGVGTFVRIMIPDKMIGSDRE